MPILIIVALAFLAMLVLNVYFRVKVLGYYKALVKNEVEFDIKDLLDTKKLKNEVVPRYPHMENEIIKFSTNIRNSILLAFGMIVLIALCWSILYLTS